jgi:hypothetical protein
MQRLFDIGGSSGSGLVSLILHHLHAPDILRVGRCCTIFLGVVMQAGVWKRCPEINVKRLIHNKSRCTRHMPVDFVADTFNFQYYIPDFCLFAESVCVRSLRIMFQFNYSASLNNILLHSSFRSLVRLWIRECSQEEVEVIATLPYLRTLTIESSETPELFRCLQRAPRLSSLNLRRSCGLSDMSALPHLTQLETVNADVLDVVDFCQTSARTKCFTHLVVHNPRMRFRDAETDVHSIVDLGPLFSVSIFVWEKSSAVLFRILRGASELRELVLRNTEFDMMEHVQALLQSNRDLHVKFSLLQFYGAPAASEIAAMKQMQSMFPDRFLWTQE